VKRNALKFKEDNILCYRCVINASKAISHIPTVEEFSIDINTKVIEVIYKNNRISKQEIRDIINDSITSGKVKTILQ